MIFIDASRYKNIKKRTGVENYSYFLINELLKLDSDNIVLISPNKLKLDVKQINIPFKRLWTQIRLSWEIIKNKKIQNLFIPSHLMPIFYPKNTIITIHDLAFKRYPKSYSFLNRIYLNWGAKFAVKHAKSIICPSKITKNDLIKFYKADKEKIHVIPLGFNKINKNNKSNILKTYKLQNKKYFLYIGRIEEKKNLKILIEVFNELIKSEKNINLVLAGKIGLNGEKILSNIKQKNIIHTGYISESDKEELLKNAFAFVFPSLFEGFGLPILEAMQANLPIIASNIPSSIEILKKNALFFNINDKKKLQENIVLLLNNPNLIKKLTQNHSNTLKKYSWKNTAKQTLNIINQSKNDKNINSHN